MKVLRNILIALSLSAISSLAFSAGGGSGKVVAVRVDATGFGIATFSNLITTPSACAIAYSNHFYKDSMAFNANTAGGRAILAALLFAQGKSSNIYVAGTGACTTYGGAAEDINVFFEINN
jgi:hypothetical protein